MSWLSSFNPTPAFPAYSGPYKVGSVDVELPADQLNSPSPAPVDDIATVAFRIFYPCENGTVHRPVRWIPGPQRGHIGAYSRFLGANPAIAEVLAFFPQLLYYVTIPVQRNAQLLENPNGQRWPVMIFSHGLGGSRNAYSYLAGSLASHGMVVLATDHRDGSAPASYIRATENHKARVARYRSLPHKISPEVSQGRDEQLKIRLWETGLTHAALLAIDTGKSPKNLDPNSLSNWRRNDHNDVLSMFSSKLDVHRPGAIAFAGHSFGGATVHQFLKSVFYRPDPEKEGYFPLYSPEPSSAIVAQITPQTPLTLLDPWCLPMQSPATRWLYEKPLPCYAPSGPGGSALLAVLSEGFYKWTDNYHETLRIMAENPLAPVNSAQTQPPPHVFYPIASAHLSQSDFGILFPWLTKKMFKSEEPERVLKLNVRAVLQVLRENGMKVAETSRIDREEEDITQSEGAEAVKGKEALDWKILDTKGAVRGWVSLRPGKEVEAVVEG